MVLLGGGQPHWPLMSCRLSLTLGLTSRVVVLVLVTEEEGRLVEMLEGLLGPVAVVEDGLAAGVFFVSEAEMLVEVVLVLVEGARRLVGAAFAELGRTLVALMSLVAPGAGCASQK